MLYLKHSEKQASKDYQMLLSNPNSGSVTYSMCTFSIHISFMVVKNFKLLGIVTISFAGFTWKRLLPSLKTSATRNMGRLGNHSIVPN